MLVRDDGSRGSRPYKLPHVCAVGKSSKRLEPLEPATDGGNSRQVEGQRE